MDTKITLTGVEAVAAPGHLSIKVRSRFSITHLRTAAYFARQVEACEQQSSGVYDDQLIFRHRAYASGTIISAVAALEASANELFADAADGHLEHIGPLGGDTIRLLASMWTRGIPRTARYPVLDKFAIALDLANRPPLDKSKPPFQDIDALIDIRNALVHYEPEWMAAAAPETPQAELHRLEKRLRGHFAPSPLVGEGTPFFPGRCLGHGCAAWAVTSAIQFLDQFFDVLGLTRPYESERAHLAPSVGAPPKAT